MKKVIFGIFAHPDDEAFGPAGTLLHEVASGNDVHLVTLTAGEAGANPDNAENLGESRLAEWQAAGKLIGATSMHHMGYLDGTLGNTTMIDASQRLEGLIADIINGYDETITVELLAFELGGLTGHIDHIAASRAACLVFYRLKAGDPRVSRIRLFCIPDTVQKTHDISWIFMDQGYSAAQITETVDVSPFRAQLEEIARAHHSQRADGEIRLAHINSSEKLIDHFLVRE